MRSIHVSMLALALTVLLCACAANVPVWETVDDELVCRDTARRPSSILYAVPDGATIQTVSPSGTPQLCTAPDGSYEITTAVYPSADPKAVIRTLTGLDPEKLALVKTTRFSLPEYQFAWSTAADEGERLCRAAMLCDEQYCYVLCFSFPAGSGTDYDSTEQAVFASFGLYYDETL